LSERAEWAGVEVLFRGEALETARVAVVLFHGYGASATDLVPVADRLTLGKGVAFLHPEGVQKLQPRGRAWFQRDRRDFASGVEAAGGVIAELAKRHPHLPIVLGGFSQGAMLTANLLVRAPSQVKAAFIWSPAELLPFPPPQDGLSFPVFLSHGRQDPILPFSGAEALRAQLTGLGVDVTWFPFDGTHTISLDVIENVNRFMDTKSSL